MNEKVHDKMIARDIFQFYSIENEEIFIASSNGGSSENLGDSQSLECDICHSSNVQETKQGYVCGECGIVLEIQKLEYYHPYNEESLQCSPLRGTQIGFMRERLRNKHSVRLKSMSKLDSKRTSEETISYKANKEIRRILSGLSFSTGECNLIFERFNKIRSKLLPGTKYRSVEKLVPLVIYFYYKCNNKPIKERELLELAKISKKDFNGFKLSILRLYPEYDERNRKEYIQGKILEIVEHFGLEMSFFYSSKKILYKLWDLIKNTTDDVIAGLTCSITSMCIQDYNLAVNSICKHLGIMMSTIQSQVKRKIIKQFRLPGFTSLIRSADIVRDAMIQLGIFEERKQKLLNKAIPKIIEIQLGRSTRVFNRLNDTDYYFFLVKDIDNNPRLIAFTFYRSFKTSNKIHQKNQRISIPNKDIRIFDLELRSYYMAKGPPLLA